MSKPLGNPAWGRPGPHWQPAELTSFDAMVKHLGLSPSQYASSRELKQWVEEHKNCKFVPLELLKIWGFRVDL